MHDMVLTCYNNFSVHVSNQKFTRMCEGLWIKNVMNKKIGI